MTATVAARADVLEPLQVPGKKLSSPGPPDLPADTLARVAALEALQVLRQGCGGSGRLAPLPATSGTAEVLVPARCRTDATFPGAEIVGCHAQVDVLEALQVLRQEFSRTGLPDPLPASSGATNALVTAPRRNNITPPSKKAVAHPARRKEAAT